MPYRPPFWRLVLAGVIAGAALYFFPFLLPALAFVFVAGLLLRLVFGFGHRGHHHALAARWNTLSEEERQRFRERFAHRCGRPWHDPMTGPAPQPQQP